MSLRRDDPSLLSSLAPDPHQLRRDKGCWQLCGSIVLAAEEWTIGREWTSWCGCGCSQPPRMMAQQERQGPRWSAQTDPPNPRALPYLPRRSAHPLSIAAGMRIVSDRGYA